MADDIRNCRDLEEQLAPYVDGEAAPAARRSIETHLAACPACRSHADRERATRDLLHANREALAPPAPESLRARCAALANPQSTLGNPQSAIANPIANRQSPTGSRQSSIQSAIFNRQSALRRWIPLSAAATLVLAVAGVFVLGLDDRVEALAASLTVDHVKCFKVGDTDSHTDAAAAARQWQSDYGWAIAVPPTDASQQLTLVGVRRCFSTDGRAAHMLYNWRGAPISLYILPENAGRDRAVERMGHEAVIWCANNRTYAVVANDGSHDLTRLVDHMKAHAK